MVNSLSLYFRYIGISVRSQMQYRASFILMSIAHLLATGIEFVGIAAMFDRFGSLAGWTLPEVAVFYGLANIAFAIADAISRGFDLFANMIKAGDFDRLLLRPRSTALQLAGQEIVLRRIGRLAQALAVLIWGASRLGIAWTLPKLLLAGAAVASGVCLFSGLFVLQAVLAFWTTESLEIVNTVTYGGVETTQYPLTIYRPWFQRFFTAVIPLACASYFPVIAILGKPDPLGSPAWFGWLSPLVGFLFLAATLQIWKFGERHYRSTGS
jgi:ABC-2 type transport system permease protein